MARAEINYDAMRIKIEFTLRLLMTLNNEGMQNGSDEEQLSEWLGDTLIAAVVLLHKHRRQGEYNLSLEEQAAALTISDFISNEFQQTASKMYEELHGLPITLSFGKQEFMFMDCVDRIIEWLKGFYAEEELING